MGINKYRDLNLKIVKSNGKIQYAGIIIDSPNSTVISEKLGGTVSIILNSSEVNSFHITASTSSSSGGRVQFYKNQNFLFVTKLWLENLSKNQLIVSEGAFSLYKITPLLGRLRSQEFYITLQNNQVGNSYYSYITLFPETIREKISAYANYENMVTIRLKSTSAHAACFASVKGSYISSPVTGTWLGYVDAYVPINEPY